MEPVGGIRRYVLLEHRVYRASRAGQIEGSRGEHSWSHDVVQPDECCAPLASVRCGHRVIDQSRLRQLQIRWQRARPPIDGIGKVDEGTFACCISPS